MSSYTTTTEVTSNAAAWITNNSLAGPRIIDTLTPVAGDFTADYDWEGIEEDFRAEVQALLPPGYDLVGEFIYCDVDAPTPDEQQREELAENIAAIGLDSIMDRWDIYTKINALRMRAYELSVEAREVEPHVLPGLYRGDWVTDANGRTLGNPDADWCVDVNDSDVVRVYAAGDIVGEEVIRGAGSLWEGSDG
jgi:hypothetical protein